MPSAFDRIAEILGERLTRAKKAQALSECIRRARGFRWVGLYDVNATHITAIGWTGSETPAFPQFPLAEGLNGVAVREAAPVIVQDVTKDPRWLATLASTRAEAIFPVLASDSGPVLGTIDVASDLVEAFKDEDRMFLTAVAETLRPFWLQYPG